MAMISPAPQPLSAAAPSLARTAPQSSKRSLLRVLMHVLGIAIASLVLLLVLGIGVWQGWKWWNARQEQAALTSPSSEEIPSEVSSATPVSSVAEEGVVPLTAVDTDGDGLSDAEEAEQGTNPERFDTDNDGLTDRAELRIYFSDPLTADTDRDGYTDGDEVHNFFNPHGPGRLFDVVNEIQKFEQE